MTWLVALLYTLGMFETTEDVGEGHVDEATDDYRDPQARIRALESEKDRHAKNAIKARKERDEAVAKLEAVDGDGSSLTEMRIESAFYRAVLERGESLDLDTAWDLGRLRGFFDTVTIEEGSSVAGMDEALDKLLMRYPWLAEDPADGPEDPAVLPKTGGARKRKDSAGQIANRASLEQRFPALRKHRHHTT